MREDTTESRTESSSNSNADRTNQPPGTIGLLRMKQALLAGLRASTFIFVAALIAATFLWLQMGANDAALQIGKRLALLGGLVFVSAVLSRWILIGKYGLEHARKSSDWSSYGFLLGLVLAGYITVERNSAPTLAQPGEVIEISGPTLDGGQFELAQLRGQVVLVDFWATWCGPCVAELPHVKQVYERFHDQGFEIIGVSFDQNRQQLQEFVERESMPWRQIFFDEKKYQGFDNPNGVRYQVNGIPTMLLIDREGRLIARGMRGAQLSIEVGQALGVAPTWSERVQAFPMRLINWLLAALLGARWFILAASTIGLGLVAIVLQLSVLRTRLPAP